MVYTGLAPRRLQFHVAPALPGLYKYTTSVDIRKTRYKASHSCRTTCKRSESAQEGGEQRYISDHQSKTENAGLIDHMKKRNQCSAHTATICFKSRPNSFENMEHRWAKTEYI